MQYVFKGVVDDSVVKIGRSARPEDRRKSLESCQNFRVKLCATFKGWGKYEHAVHHHLAHANSSDGAGKEWFNVSTAEAVREISETVLQAAAEERHAKRPRLESHDVMQDELPEHCHTPTLVEKDLEDLFEEVKFAEKEEEDEEEASRHGW